MLRLGQEGTGKLNSLTTVNDAKRRNVDSIRVPFSELAQHVTELVVARIHCFPKCSLEVSSSATFASKLEFNGKKFRDVSQDPRMMGSA